MSLKDICSRNNFAWLPISLIVLAELLIFLGQLKPALIIHALNLTLLILLDIYVDNRIYTALMLLPLFRLLNLAMPVFFNITIYTYPLVYAPMFIPIYIIMRSKIFSPAEAGFTMKNFLFYLPLAITVGLVLGLGEHKILGPGVLIPDLSLKYILVLFLTMTLFVGVVEEFVFRSSLQTVMGDWLGALAGLLLTSLLFGMMHSGYHVPFELLYVTLAGVVFGLLFWLTKSLPVIAVSHGLTNVSLFLLAPVYPDVLIYFIAVSGFMFIAVASLYKKQPWKIGSGN